MNNFVTRSLSAFVYAAVFIFAIQFSEKTYIALITFFASVCIWEFSKIINSKATTLYLLVSIILMVLGYYSIINKDFIFVMLSLSIITLTYLIINLYNTSYLKLRELQRFILQICYVVFSFFFLAYLPFKETVYQPNLIIFIILIIWSNDSFAYLVGKNFGKHKLFERISPKKTIEGFIGGLIFSIITAIVISYFSPEYTMINWIVISIIVSVLGTFGDLVESKFKRQANVKDSGTIMPGHGGLLDRLDSLFFLAPFVYLYLHYLL